MSDLISKVKDALSSSKAHETTSTHTSTTTSSGYGPSGPVDPALSATHAAGQPGYDTNTMGSTNAGPHNSNVANKLDPRVDSDMDNRSNLASHVGGLGNTQGNQVGHRTTTGSTNYGPHNSNLANKVDPRVDSNPDGQIGATHTTYTTPGVSGTTGSTKAGPHSFNLGNKLDPRVDSDLDGRGGVGTHTVTTDGAYGTTGSTNAGPHGSNIANKLDPRLDSDADHRNDPSSRIGGLGETQATSGYGGPGSASAHQRTATGPHVGNTGYSSSNATGGHNATTGTASVNDPAKVHSSNLLNKLDPRVKTDEEGRPL